MTPLQRENLLVLQVVQASLGLVSPDVVGIAIEIRSDQAIVHFAVRQETEEIGEDISDIIFELDVLLEGSELLEPRVYVGAPGKNWPGRVCRLVHLAKGN